MKTMIISMALMLTPSLSLSNAAPETVELRPSHTIQTWIGDGPIIACPRHGCEVSTLPTNEYPEEEDS